jgi:nuclear transport factor 2 (NTF2) superfamily protein
MGPVERASFLHAQIKTDQGLMRVRFACINDLPIKESDRKYHWPLGRRPDDHPGLSDLGL